MNKVSDTVRHHQCTNICIIGVSEKEERKKKEQKKNVK